MSFVTVPVLSSIGCAYIAHPFGLEEKALSAMSGPISIVAEENDSAFTAEERYIAEDKLRKSNQPLQINGFSGMEHGFAVCGNPRIKADCYTKDQAFLQAVASFDCFLGLADETAHIEPNIWASRCGCFAVDSSFLLHEGVLVDDGTPGFFSSVNAG